MYKVPLAKHNDMVEHFPPDRANQPFSIGILPWRSRCRWSVANAHRAKPPDECLAIGAIAIANNIVYAATDAERVAATDDVQVHFLTILSNGMVTTDGVGPHGDLLADFPYLGPPHAAARFATPQ
jgi:hypothetical protein